MKTAICLSALLLLSSVTLRAQQEQQPLPAPDGATYQLKLKAQVVVLDVVVTDKQGAIVRNLTKDDFIVTENRAPQRVRTLDQPGVEAAKVPSQIHSTAELDKLAPDAPVSIIVLGEGSTSFNDQAYARYSLKEYLKTQGDVLTQPVMLAAADHRRFMVLHDYTTSRQEVLTALDHHFANPPFAPDAPVGSVAMTGFRVLLALAQATQGHPGHKNVIWIGKGTVHVNIGALTPDQAVGLREQIATTTNALRDARVTLYMVDPSGVGGGRGGTSGQVKGSGTDQLYSNGFGKNPFDGVIDYNTMALATGGKVFYNHNDVDAMISTSLRDGTEFYTLSYVPEQVLDTNDQFRNVHVEMKDKSLRVSTREGYFNKTPALAAVKTASGRLDKRLLQDINIAGQNLLVYDGIPLTVQRDASAPDKFVLHMEVSNGETLTGADGKQEPEVTLLVNSFDKHGKLLVHDGRFVRLHSSGGGVSTQATRTIDYPYSIATGAPTARVRFVVRDNVTGKVGADNVFLIDRKELSDSATGTNAEKPKK